MLMADSRHKSRQRWNASHYTQVKISINPNIADAFKSACAADGVSMAGVISRFMADYTAERGGACAPSQEPKAVDVSDRYKTRKARRSAVKTIAVMLNDMLTAEERYFNNVPVNLHGSKWHEASETSIAIMQEIINLMKDIYD
jgi:hypothetical protein